MGCLQYFFFLTIKMHDSMRESLCKVPAAFSPNSVVSSYGSTKIIFLYISDIPRIVKVQWTFPLDPQNWSVMSILMEFYFRWNGHVFLCLNIWSNIEKKLWILRKQDISVNDVTYIYIYEMFHHSDSRGHCPSLTRLRNI